MKNIILLCLGLLLSACASLPAKSVAIETALVRDAAIRESAAVCRQFNTDVRRLSERAQLDWWQRNKDWVLAADYGLMTLNWENYRDQAEAQRALNGMVLMENVRLDAVALSENWLGQRPQAEKCIRLFTRIDQQKLDLTSDSRLFAELSSLDQQRRQNPADVSAVRAINTRYRKYGRSLFSVEAVLSASGCQNPQIALLRNNWPLEVYDGLCSGDDYLLVKCEWGRCEIKR